MRIDHTRIAIRERAWLDNLDLALHVIRTQAAGVFLAAVAGVLPVLLLNYVLLRDTLLDPVDVDFLFGPLALLTLVVMIEAPLATAPLTLYLGQAMFAERVDRRQIARQLALCLPQLIVFQLLLRGFLILPVLTWVVPYALWPYLNEVILLERNPLVGRDRQLSTMKRSSLLHRSGADYLVRAVGSGLLSLALIVALWTSQYLAFDWLLGIQLGWTGGMIAFQCVLWVVVVYFAVARFLNYLDQRIRNEGWEVELSLRAQRDRLMGQAA